MAEMKRSLWILKGLFNRPPMPIFSCVKHLFQLIKNRSMNCDRSSLLIAVIKMRALLDSVQVADISIAADMRPIFFRCR
jgi:hypothetical protein